MRSDFVYTLRTRSFASIVHSDTVNGSDVEKAMQLYKLNCVRVKQLDDWLGFHPAIPDDPESVAMYDVPAPWVYGSGDGALLDRIFRSDMLAKVRLAFHLHAKY
jgi:hypothetical protein